MRRLGIGAVLLDEYGVEIFSFLIIRTLINDIYVRVWQVMSYWGVAG